MNLCGLLFSDKFLTTSLHECGQLLSIHHVIQLVLLFGLNQMLHLFRCHDLSDKFVGYREKTIYCVVTMERPS